MTGLADALMLTGLRYGSEDAARQARVWAGWIERAAYVASAHLACKKGAFPLFDRDAYLAGETVRGLDRDVRALIAKHGARNGLLTSVAPTGTDLAGVIMSVLFGVVLLVRRRSVPLFASALTVFGVVLWGFRLAPITTCLG